MDPGLCETMMSQGKLPNLASLRRNGGFSVLGTSTPPQSPVAWASFINGAGPGSHGIFDFIHRDPARQAYPFFSAARTTPGEGHIDFKNYQIPLEFWPFNHKAAETVLLRQGTPFWDYLDQVGIRSTFYDLPSNYPPSPSKYGNHQCLSGMGTPDLLGTYGTYQYFTEDGPEEIVYSGGGNHSRIEMDGESSTPLRLEGPPNALLKKPEPTSIDFVVHRDQTTHAVVIEIQGQTFVLKEGQWSDWVDVDFTLSTPALLPDKNIKGICRFYVQEVSPVLKVYVSPINADPNDPCIQITEPAGFSSKMAGKLGPFYTTGFQEDHKALSNGVFSDAEFIAQAEDVLQERINLLNYALDQYKDGLLFFYFSSTDLQAHMLWWDSEESHPVRSPGEAKKCFQHLQSIYTRMDDIVGDLLTRYGDSAHLIIMSDHGFSNFKRQFNLNTWLCQYGYLEPYNCSSILTDADWSKSTAYGLGINSLYLNLKGREKDGIVEPAEKDQLLDRLVSELESICDYDGRQVIRKVHRTDQIYSGAALKYAPDLIVGYSRDYRASWDTCLGKLSPGFLMDNDSAWSADHCMDASEVPGVLFSNRPIVSSDPSLVDLAPSILTEFGLDIPSTMTGRNIFES
jgi:predicted AlkP superfamily phosphohydrolase/phosphomutase